MSLRISGLENAPLELADRPTSKASSSSFEGTLSAAVGQVESLQKNADAQAEKVAAGAGNLHETALALEKADVAMRLAVKVRNKLVDAYNEVMRMSV